MDGADPGAGKKRDRQFRNHRQVDCDPVASFYAHLLQDIGESADLGVKHLIGINPYIVFRFTLPDESGLVAAAVSQMAVKTVCGNIQLSIDKPVNFRFVKIIFKHFVPFFVPVKQF